MTAHAKLASRARDFGSALAIWLPVTALVAWAWLRFLPSPPGLLGPDYSFWLPAILAGDYFHAQNGWLQIAWFSPAQCGGIPLHADPQGAYLSLPQFLSFALPPLRVLQVTFLVYDSAGFFGTFFLARRGFGLSLAASSLAAALFAANSFYGARFVIGHLSFAPFMLLPAASLCLVGGLEILTWAALLGVLVAVLIESGTAVMLPPFYLSLLAVLALHRFARDQGSLLPLARLAAGTAWGLLLSAGKLTVMLALLAHFPRDALKLPGFLSIGETAWAALRALFIGPFADMTERFANASVRMEQHEFEYCIGPVPALLILGGIITARRQGWRATKRQRLALDALVVLLLIPLALNTYGAGWSALLKMLPVIRSSSSLLRFFAADMLPLILAAALGLDFLARAAPRWRAWLAGACFAAAALAVLLPTRSFYGPQGSGTYDPAAMQAGWRALHAGGTVPAVARIAVIDPKAGLMDKLVMQRQDGMTHGESPLFCYGPLFGYRLENFPRGSLHAGSVFDRTGEDLNIKNPACDIFPKVNGCKPGDAFSVGAIDQARRFVAYQSFAWRKPAWAVLASWMGFVLWPITLILLMPRLWRLTRTPAI
jgi:hypothetical protein